MRLIIILITLVFLLGCASTLTVDKNGLIQASDYTIQVSKDGTIIATPKPGFLAGALASLFQSLVAATGQLMPMAGQVITPGYAPVPSPALAPVPVPVRPYP